MTFKVVGVAGFEPATSCSQSRRANRTTLYPEYRVQLCGERGIRTPGTLDRYVSLANWWFQPLTHLSGCIDIIAMISYDLYERPVKQTAKIGSFFDSANINQISLRFFSGYANHRNHTHSNVFSKCLLLNKFILYE